MDKDEALQIAADKAAVLRTWSYDELVAALLGEPETTEVAAPSGATYQLEATALWEAEQGGDLRVTVAVDDGGLRHASAPLAVDFIMAPDGTFVDD